MGELSRQIAGGGLRMVTDDEALAARDATAAMLDELRDIGRLVRNGSRPGELVTWTTWPCTANEYVGCNRPLSAEELSKALAFGEGWLVRCESVLEARGLVLC